MAAVPDHTQFRRPGVAKLGRSMVSDIPLHAPALVIPPSSTTTATTTTQIRQLLSKPVGKNIHHYNDLPFLSIPHHHLCRGSYLGWLVLVTDAMDMYLYNPLTGARFDLPPASYLPNPLDNDLSKWNIHKVVLSRSPSSSKSSDCFVLVFYGNNEIAYCKVGNHCWRTVDGPGPRVYIDGVFNMGKFFILDISGRVYASDLTNTGEEPVPLHLPIPPPTTRTPKLIKRYFVELEGEVYQITREITISRNDEKEAAVEKHIQDEELEASDEYDFDNNIRSDVRNLTHRTAMFQVFKLDTSTSDAQWIEVKDLNGGAMFVGMNQSFALPSSNLMGYEGDRIYYTDDSTDAQKLSLRSGNDMGVFRLEDSSFSPLYLTNSECVKPHPVWITPMP